jgi:hypothetical protein
MTNYILYVDALIIIQLVPAAGLVQVSPEVPEAPKQLFPVRQVLWKSHPMVLSIVASRCRGVTVQLEAKYRV